jgi:kynureninase
MSVSRDRRVLRDSVINSRQEHAVTTDDLARWRDEFPILSRSVYMINNSLGAMPRQSARNLAEYADAWATQGVRAWDDRWWNMPIEVGDQIARVVGAETGTVSMHENVTTAHMVALSCQRPTGARRRIVCSAMDFPSMVYLYRAQQAAGFELGVVPADDDLTVGTDRMLEAIDDTTAVVVAFSHVLFRTSYIMDAAAIINRAHEVGAVVILDTYQSAGIVPVDLAVLGVDFAVGGCLKWLCGGPGNAFLYTRPVLLSRAQPSFTGWLARQDPFAFDISDGDAVRTDAMRMMNGDAVDSGVLRGAGRARHHQHGRRRSRSDRVDADDRAAAGSGGPVRLHVGGLARSGAAGRLCGGERAGGAARGPHAQSARIHRGLPANGRHPCVAALPQHDGRNRPADGGDGGDRGDEALRRRRSPLARHVGFGRRAVWSVVMLVDVFLVGDRLVSLDAEIGPTCLGQGRLSDRRGVHGEQ